MPELKTSCNFYRKHTTKRVILSRFFHFFRFLFKKCAVSWLFLRFFPVFPPIFNRQQSVERPSRRMSSAPLTRSWVLQAPAARGVNKARFFASFFSIFLYFFLFSLFSLSFCNFFFNFSSFFSTPPLILARNRRYQKSPQKNHPYFWPKNQDAENPPCKNSDTLYLLLDKGQTSQSPLINLPQYKKLKSCDLSNPYFFKSQLIVL